MKVLCVVALLALSASAIPIDNDENHVSGENGWYVPQVDGSLVWMDKVEAQNKLREEEAREGRLELTLTPVNFYLYTRSNPTKSVEITAKKASIDASNFNANHPTRFIIHGWTQGEDAPMNQEIRDAFLSNGDFNIIVVDWARARSYEYISSVSAVPNTGAKVANMINYLVSDYKMPLSNLIVIGHSLGAHVSGHAGKNVNGKINTIVGLDPALPLYSYDSPNGRLTTTDAEYVESIQTCGGLLGFLQPIGKGAFYPNGGSAQPGCGLDLTGSCAHSRSTIYYAEAVATNNFPTMKCGQYEEATKKNCGSTYSSVRMAANTNPFVVDGYYYVPVNSNAPFGMGA